MEFPIVFALLGLLHFAASTSPDCTFESISPSKTLAWCPCNDGFFCAKLEVPLDYQNPDLGLASVPLIKYPAQSNSTDGPYQGMMLFNPGGPGVSGVLVALGNSNLIQTVAGTNWDIIGFDTRGVGLSEPAANCSPYDTLHSRSVPTVLDEFYDSYIKSGKELGEQCAQTIRGENDAGPHMTTAVTARDMLSIVNAFAKTEDGLRASKPSCLLNYYGMSYGTFLGETFASMFPRRVGNMVLDGAVSPENYLTNYTSSAVNHLDGVIASFFIYCHAAGASDCAYYTGSSPKDMYERFNRSFVELNPQKAETEKWSNATDLQDALLTLKVTFLSVTHEPFSFFTRLPDILLDLESAISAHEIRPWTERVNAIIGNPNAVHEKNAEWRLGVLCSDQNNKFYNKTLQDLRPLLEALERQSIVGEVWSKSMLGCTGWPIKSHDIFTGPFGGDTKTPILFVGNTYDPATPIENSISSAPNYKNAQVLTVDGIGHCISATRNRCGMAKIRTYLQAGKLPGKESFCPLEKGPFDIVLNEPLKETIRRAGLENLVY